MKPGHWDFLQHSAASDKESSRKQSNPVPKNRRSGNRLWLETLRINALVLVVCEL